MGVGGVPALDLEVDDEPRAARLGIPQAGGAPAPSRQRRGRRPGVQKTSPPSWRRLRRARLPASPLSSGSRTRPRSGRRTRSPADGRAAASSTTMWPGDRRGPLPGSSMQNESRELAAGPGRPALSSATRSVKRASCAIGFMSASASGTSSATSGTRSAGSAKLVPIHRASGSFALRRSFASFRMKFGKGRRLG